ncbi:MAG: MOSC domain-containing protein, partial [Nitrospira sp.]
MKLVSVQVGRPRTVRWRGKAVSTGIYKEPVAGRIMLHRFNLDGDGQSDLTVHGGWDKAVYVYPAEHYPIWQAEFPGMRLPYGMFGENFT